MGGQWIDAVGEGNGDLLVAELGIEAITKHGIDQLIYRGVSPSAVLDALKNPTRTRRRPNMTTQYVGNDATVVLNDYGGLVTVWPR
jgi:hypothetical protein